ncbi:MAG: hypothetical protein RLZZ282_56 [Verrucomicrobiota bacterium]|jgi:opacity protein-like surface antigen
MKVYHSIVLIGLSACAHAGTSIPNVTNPSPVAADAWEFRLGLPGWMSGLKGDAGVLGKVTSVDASCFSDIVPVIDMVATLSFEARKGRWGILTSGIYMDLSDVASPQGPLVDEVHLQLKQLLLDGAVSYAVVDNERGSLELLAGARYNYIYSDLSIVAGNTTFASDGSKSWIDPYVGLLGRAKLTESIAIVGKGDIGGFDVGSSLTWQLYGGIECQLAKSCYLGAGYRYLSVDYTSGGFTYDMATSGPQIELGFNF